MSLSYKEFKDMSHDSIKAHLETLSPDNPCKSKTPYRITIPPRHVEYPKTAFIPAEMMMLPLSLEDECLTCGTASILQEFRKEFGIPGSKLDSYLPFDKKKKEFDLSAARERYLFYQWMDEHKTDMANLETAIASSDRVLAEEQNRDGISEQGNENDAEDLDLTSFAFKERMKKKDAKLKSTLQDLVTATERATLRASVGYLKSNYGAWSGVTDSFARTLLHCAVEAGKVKFTEALLASGAEVNASEGCGATPLMLAVAVQNIEITRLLVNYGATIDGCFCGMLPSPKEMAEAMESEELMDYFREKLRDEKEQLCNILRQLGLENQSLDAEVNMDDDSGHESKLNGRQCTLIADCKSCINVRGTRNRSPDEFENFQEVPGDFHTQGYIMECIARFAGPTGFYFICQQVLNRKRVTPKSFQKIFNEGNYQRNFNALVDVYWGTGIAAVKEFEASELFPPTDILDKAYRRYGNVNQLILSTFKDWLNDRSQKDVMFKEHAKFITTYVPTLLTFHDSVRYGNSITLEAVWMEILPWFPALNKKNYRDEAFVHIIHLFFIWPEAVTELLRRNRTISLLGKTGHNVALDEYAEMMCVKPLKMYAKHHTTVAMLKKVAMNVELLQLVKRTYRESFVTVTGSTSSVPDVTPDLHKITWFCIQNQWFQDKGRTQVYNIPHVNSTLPTQLKPVKKECLDPESRGRKAYQDNFQEMLYRLFPVTVPFRPAREQRG